MRRFPAIPFLAMALACASFSPLPASAPRTAAAEPDWLSIVGLYPQPGTPTGYGEQAILFWLQTSRTAQDVARANAENTPSFGCYAQDIHLPYALDGQEVPVDIRDFPRTEAVLDQARQDLLPILQSLQATFDRPHPYVLYTGLQPAVPLVSGPSYPSPNATLGTVFAEIIAQYDKADVNALRTTGKLLGTDRVLGGVHYPSDVDAGQRLGKAFATWWIDDHLALIQTACSEWNAATAR